MSREVKTTREASRKDHLPYEARHIDDVEWEIRWPGETGKCFSIRALSARQSQTPASVVWNLAPTIPSTIMASRKSGTSFRASSSLMAQRISPERCCSIPIRTSKVSLKLTRVAIF